MKRKIEMKKVLVITGMSLLLGSRFLVVAGEREPLRSHQGFDFTIICEGETKFIDVPTGCYLPRGDMHVLFAIALGSGELCITMEKSDAGGQLVLMTGYATSAKGTIVPIFKTGFTPNALSEIVEMDNGEAGNGFLFLVTGVLFSLTGVGEEGEYTIELVF